MTDPDFEQMAHELEMKLEPWDVPFRRDRERFVNALRSAYQRGAEDEREACAKIVDDEVFANPWVRDIAAQIRARGTK